MTSDDRHGDGDVRGVVRYVASKVQAHDAWLALALVSAIAAHAIDDYSISFPLSIAVVLFALIWSWRNR